MTTLTSRAAEMPRTPCGPRPSSRSSSSRWPLAPVMIGSRNELPPPFGRAANGLVAYAASGDIFTVDPAQGPTAIVIGPGRISIPAGRVTGRISPRRAEGGGRRVGPGSGVRRQSRWLRWSPAGYRFASSWASSYFYYFSPDGTQLLIAYEGGLDAGHGFPSVLIAATDGSGVPGSRPDHGRPPMPPGGRRMASEILFVGVDSDADQLLCDPRG